MIQRTAGSDIGCHRQLDRPAGRCGYYWVEADLEIGTEAMAESAYL